MTPEADLSPETPADTPAGEGLASPSCSRPPNPGSDEAIKMGCLCPVLDNARGKGYMCIEGVFVYREDCPIHCANAEDRHGAERRCSVLHYNYEQKTTN